MAGWSSQVQQRAWRCYIEASLRLETRLDADLRETTGLSLIDYHVLLLLSEAPQQRLRMGLLANRMVFSPSRLTYQINSMEKRGLVVRERSPEDRRGYRAVLTASGADALHSAAPQHQTTVRALFADDLDETELHTLLRVFGRLHARLTDAESATRGDERVVDDQVDDGSPGSAPAEVGLSR